MTAKILKSLLEYLDALFHANLLQKKRPNGRRKKKRKVCGNFDPFCAL